MYILIKRSDAVEIIIFILTGRVTTGGQMIRETYN